MADMKITFSDVIPLVFQLGDLQAGSKFGAAQIQLVNFRLGTRMSPKAL